MKKIYQNIATNQQQSTLLLDMLKNNHFLVFRIISKSLLLRSLNRLQKNENFDVVFHIVSNLKENIFSNLKHEKNARIFIVYIFLRVIFM